MPYFSQQTLLGDLVTLFCLTPTSLNDLLVKVTGYHPDILSARADAHQSASLLCLTRHHFNSYKEKETVSLHRVTFEINDQRFLTYE